MIGLLSHRNAKQAGITPFEGYGLGDDVDTCGIEIMVVFF